MSAKESRSSLANLAFALGMGLLALALTLFGMLSDTRRAASERAALAELSKRPIATTSSTRTAVGLRVHRLGGKGEPLFGIVLPIRFSEGAVLAAALFRPSGELKAMRSADASRAFDVKEIEALLQGFVGWDGRYPAPSEGRHSASDDGAWDTRHRSIVAALAIEKAADAVRAAAKENP